LAVLFLLNEKVLDLGLPEVCLRTSAGADAPRLERLPASAVVLMGREMYFRAGPGIPDGKARLILASLIALKSEADGALFVRGPEARRPQDVVARFVQLPITTMHYLESMQTAGSLTPAKINELVWRAASAA
jgi:hypothetical protein